MVRRVIAVLLLSALTAVFVALGFWQLDRADQKRELAERLEQARPGDYAALVGAIRSPDELVFRQVEVTGRFVTPQIILDARKHRGQLGFYRVVPFRLAGTDQHLLVNLGWHPGKAVDYPAQLSLPAGRLTLQGWLGTASGGIHPGFDRPGAAQVGIWIYLDPEYLAAAQGYPVLPLELYLETDLHDDLVRDWERPEPDPGMHIAYAIQWFSFAAVLIIFSIWRIRVYMKTKHE